MTAWIVAGGLIALVYSAGPLRDAVRSAPWLMGPGLWLLTALGAGALLRSLPGRDYPRAALALATIAGGGADALVVAAGHPGPASWSESVCSPRPRRSSADRPSPEGRIAPPGTGECRAGLRPHVGRPIKHKVVLQIAVDVLVLRW